MMDGILLQTIEGLSDGSLTPPGGQTWEWLQGEKEEIARELLSEGPLCQTPVSGVQEAETSVECDLGWHHRSQLEARLRKIIDAQDRLLDGAYGRCMDCGGEIGNQRLAADPATQLCISCQRIIEGEAALTSASRPAGSI